MDCGLTAEPEIGKIYDGKIVKVMDFGAFVNFFGPKDGLVHVSELAQQRVASPKDVVKEGQAVKVKLLGFDDRGKVRLSMKQVDQTTGEDSPARRRMPPRRRLNYPFRLTMPAARGPCPRAVCFWGHRQQRKCRLTGHSPCACARRGAAGYV